MNQEDHAKAVKRTLDAVFRHVRGARQAFPALAAVHDSLAVQGLKALEKAPKLDRDEVIYKLAALLPAFGPRQLEAIAHVLTTIDRRSMPRQRSGAAQVSTPTMFAVEVPMEVFIDALEAAHA